MAQDPKQQRARKRLLVATVGVATVSFLSLQTGCEDDEYITTVANLLAVPLDSSIDMAVVRDASTDATPLFPSANLIAVPVDSGPMDASGDALTTSGNLLPPPQDASGDALITSGNLIPPPHDAAADAASDAATARDAKADTGAPSGGYPKPGHPRGTH
jgi:hypothetical protein